MKMEFYTPKQAMEVYPNIIRVPDRRLNELLKYRVPCACVMAESGKACDIYEIRDNLALSIGTNPIGNIRPRKSEFGKYEWRAMKIFREERDNKKLRMLEDLFNEFVSDMMKFRIA